MKYRLIVENEIGRFVSDADEMSDEQVQEAIALLKQAPSHMEIKQRGAVVVFPQEVLRRSVFTLQPTRDE